MPVQRNAREVRVLVVLLTRLVAHTGATSCVPAPQQPGGTALLQRLQRRLAVPDGGSDLAPGTAPHLQPSLSRASELPVAQRRPAFSPIQDPEHVFSGISSRQPEVWPENKTVTAGSLAASVLGDASANRQPVVTGVESEWQPWGADPQVGETPNTTEKGNGTYVVVDNNTGDDLAAVPPKGENKSTQSINTSENGFPAADGDDLGPLWLSRSNETSENGVTAADVVSNATRDDSVASSRPESGSENSTQSSLETSMDIRPGNGANRNLVAEDAKGKDAKDAKEEGGKSQDSTSQSTWAWVQSRFTPIDVIGFGGAGIVMFLFLVLADII